MTNRNPSEPFSPFLPATYSIPQEDDRRESYLVDRFSNFADVINDKKIGIFRQGIENINGNKFYYDTTKKTRGGYQSLARIPSFPNAGVLTLTTTSDPVFPVKEWGTQFIISQVWGSASKPCSSIGAGDGDFFSFYSQGDSRISFTMSDTQIVITTTVDLSAYQGFIIIDFIKDGT